MPTFITSDDFPNCPQFTSFLDKLPSVVTDSPTESYKHLTLFAAFISSDSVNNSELILKTGFSIQTINRIISSWFNWDLIYIDDTERCKFQSGNYLWDSSSEEEIIPNAFQEDLQTLSNILDDVKKRCRGKSQHVVQDGVVQDGVVQDGVVQDGVEQDEQEQGGEQEQHGDAQHALKRKLEEIVTLADNICAVKKHISGLLSASKTHHKEIKALSMTLTKERRDDLQTCMRDFVEDIQLQTGILWKEHTLWKTQCPICKDIAVDPCATTECGHIICYNCNETLSADGGRKIKCPTCRVRTTTVKLYV